LAAAATVVMGEGAEQTPLAVIGGADFVVFQEQDPTADEIHDVKLTMEEDLFAPFLTLAAWKKGRGQ
jgi:F420-0:gamma-glutamyl ligase